MHAAAIVEVSNPNWTPFSLHPGTTYHMTHVARVAFAAVEANGKVEVVTDAQGGISMRESQDLPTTKSATEETPLDSWA